MDDFYLNDSSTEEMQNEILHLRQENENLRNRIAELEDEIREYYESIEIDKMPDSDYDSWLENDYHDEDE